MKLIDKDALVAEIDKKIKATDYPNYGAQRIWAYNDVKEIIDTLEVKEVDFEKEEPVSEDLEKEFNRFLNVTEGVPPMWRDKDQLEWALDIARHFAEWQKRQMMKDAVDAEINYWNLRGLSLRTDINLEDIASEGDEVKLIIIKEK